jgi:glycosyltransferase involved in cell wall biosynthesis
MMLEQLAGGDREELGPTLYPAAEHVHYATLNSRDRDFLVEAGADPARCVRVGNPVTLGDVPHDDEEPDAGPRRYVYPARAIRRKNIGEVLLWAALAEGDESFAITRAPRNPSARPVYDRWVEFGRSLDLPVQFETGEDSDEPLARVLRRASAVITTSVAEGFGMTYLEPWLAERPVVGRNLPAITQDFEECGINLSHLYDRLDVPLEWVGKPDLRQRLESGLRNYRSSYGLDTSADDIQEARQSIARDDMVDFGRLDEPLQEKVIRRVDREADPASAIAPNHPGSPARASASLEENRRAVREHFAPRVYAQRLLELYRRAAGANVSEVGHLSAGRLLRQFSSPDRFSLLRTGRP